MGNTIGGGSKRTTKVMNIKGETTRLKTPIQAMEVTKSHPGHVLLDSESVKHFGIRAKALDPAQYLEPKRVYFLVELPKFPEDHHREPRRVRSGGIHLGAKERLESLMLSRRSISDLSVMNPAGSVAVDEAADGAVRVKMRLPRAEVERLVSQSKDKAEAAEKIMDLYMGKSGSDSDSGSDAGSVSVSVSDRSSCGGFGSPDRRMEMEQVPRVRREARREKSPLGVVPDGYKKRVSFLPTKEAETQLVFAS